MTQIRVTPAELRSVAEQLELAARRISSATNTVDQTIKGAIQGDHFKGVRAQEIIVRYQHIAPTMDTWQQQLMYFADMLQIAADRFEEADNRANASMEEPFLDGLLLFDGDGKLIIPDGTFREKVSYLRNLASKIRDAIRRVIEHIRNTPAGRELLNECEKNGLRLEVGGKFVGGDPNGKIVKISLGYIDGLGTSDGNTMGQASQSRRTIKLDNVDMMDNDVLLETLSHELQHQLDYKQGLVSRQINDTSDISKNALDSAETRAQLISMIEHDVDIRAKTEIRAWERGESVVDGTGYNVNDPLTDSDVTNFFREHENYRENYQEYYTELVRDATGDDSVIVRIDGNGNVTFRHLQVGGW